MVTTSERVVPVRLTMRDWAAVVAVMLGLGGVQVWAVASWVTGLEHEVNAARDDAARAQRSADETSVAIDELNKDLNGTLQRIASDIGELKGIMQSRGTTK